MKQRHIASLGAMILMLLGVPPIAALTIHTDYTLGRMYGPGQTIVPSQQLTFTTTVQSPGVRMIPDGSTIAWTVNGVDACKNRGIVVTSHYCRSNKLTGKTPSLSFHIKRGAAPQRQTWAIQAKIRVPTDTKPTNNERMRWLQVIPPQSDRPEGHERPDRP